MSGVVQELRNLEMKNSEIKMFRNTKIKISEYIESYLITPSMKIKDYLDLIKYGIDNYNESHNQNVNSWEIDRATDAAEKVVFDDDLICQLINFSGGKLKLYRYCLWQGDTSFATFNQTNQITKSNEQWNKILEKYNNDNIVKRGESIIPYVTFGSIENTYLLLSDEMLMFGDFVKDICMGLEKTHKNGGISESSKYNIKDCPIIKEVYTNVPIFRNNTFNNLKYGIHTIDLYLNTTINKSDILSANIIYGGMNI